MSRSSRKGPYVDIKLLEKVEKQKESGAKTPIKTWSRACTVVPDFIGHVSPRSPEWNPRSPQRAASGLARANAWNP